MKYVYSFLIIFINTVSFSQNKVTSLGDCNLIFPSIKGYVECENEKIAKPYKDLFIADNLDLLAIYLNDESYEFNQLSLLYDGISDFGYFTAIDEFKKDKISKELFKEIIKYQDSVAGDVDSSILVNNSNNFVIPKNPTLISNITIKNTVKTYTHILPVDSLNVFCFINNHICIKERYFQFTYYVKIKDKSSIANASSTNFYILQYFLSHNEVEISLPNSKLVPQKETENIIQTSDGFNLGIMDDVLPFFIVEDEIIDVNGIKISNSKFWECNLKNILPNMNSKNFANILEKNNFDELLPEDYDLKGIMRCIGDDFSVGESYIDFCVERYIHNEIHSMDEAKQFCQCEFKMLKDRVNTYQEYLDYFDEIGDLNKPSYNEIILPCRNTIKIHQSPNTYVPLDIEGFSDQSIVKLTPDGTTYKIKLIIGGVVRYFVFDTGASELVINSELEQELLTNGKISSDDYVASKEFEIADGSVIKARGVRLNNIVIAGFRVNNVVAYITDDGGMLCGMGLMNKFKTWEFDKENQMLTIYK